MHVCTTKKSVIAKIVSQDCSRREDLDDETSLYFSIKYRSRVWSFCIPQPLEDDGYTQKQLRIIEIELSRLGLELLPLDPHLH